MNLYKINDNLKYKKILNLPKFKFQLTKYKATILN